MPDAKTPDPTPRRLTAMQVSPVENAPVTLEGGVSYVIVPAEEYRALLAERTQLREALREMMADGLDEFWEQCPDGLAAVARAQALLEEA